MFRFIVSLVAGILAGVATGFSGLSAAVFISPMLVSFLNINTFDAVGIALASDVLASFSSAITYQRNKNTDIKNGKILLISVVAFSIVGTLASFKFVANETNNEIMGYWLIISSIMLGLKMLFKPRKDDEKPKFKSPFNNTITSILCGSYIGFVCGFQGTGGGLMMLFVLNYLLNFEFKKAVGTSLIIMTLTALVGAISHFAMAGGLNQIFEFVVCVLSTFIAAKLSAIAANKMNPVTVKKITGFLIVFSGIITLLAKIF